MSLQDPAHPLLSRLLAALTPGERARCVVYMEDPAGSTGLEAAPAVGDHHRLAFVDLQPGANWMHPALWLVAPTSDSSDEPVKRISTHRPPLFGPLPAGWSVIWQSPGIESWQCLALADAPTAS